MAGLIRTLTRRTLLSAPKTLIQNLLWYSISVSTEQNAVLMSTSRPTSQIIRNYISEMRKSAFEGNILRLLRNEIQYELERSPLMEPVTKYASFAIDDRPGKQWIGLKRKFGDEDIKIEVTMFDAVFPSAKSGGNIGEDVLLHITLIVNITKGGGGSVLEIMCSAWPDSLEIKKLFIRHPESLPAEPYIGPEFKELDDEMQDSLYGYLEERGIDDKFAAFLHGYLKNKDKTEFIRWMETVKSFIKKE